MVRVRVRVSPSLATLFGSQQKVQDKNDGKLGIYPIPTFLNKICGRHPVNAVASF
jgi:hypothetical protein